jgi:hypothetical protein
MEKKEHRAIFILQFVVLGYLIFLGILLSSLHVKVNNLHMDVERLAKEEPLNGLQLD